MRFLWLCLILQAVFPQASFGKSFFGNSNECRNWTCMNQKFNFTNVLPPKQRYVELLATLLPPDSWQDVVPSVVDACYTETPSRIYSNECPGQSLMHCIVDMLVQNCPAEYWNKNDGCTPVGSIAEYSYMFSQSRYQNLEANIPTERRPAFFLRHQFRSKCCNLPQIYSKSLLNECGFEELMHYHYHAAQNCIMPFCRNEPSVQDVTTKKTDDTVLTNVYDFNMLPDESTTAKSNTQYSHHGDVSDDENNEEQDPLDCCELDNFIQTSWRSECGFKLRWDSKELVIQNDTGTKTEMVYFKDKDIKIVPISCENERCIFGKLNIVSDTGVVNKDAFRKFLDNMTNKDPKWTNAKSKVVSECLNKRLSGYDTDCEINKILACTFDYLSEFCPDREGSGNDLCKDNTEAKEGVVCQISTSKYRPNRRQFCNLPRLVSTDVLSECGVTSLFRSEYVSPLPPKCTEMTKSTSCVMKKMGVLTKYGFVDYFNMKEKIRRYSDGLTHGLYQMHSLAFMMAPRYRKHCSSPKKLLNVIETMLTVCPMSNRKRNRQCNKLYSDLSSEIFDDKVREALETMISMYYPTQTTIETTTKKATKTVIVNNKLYDFGFLGSKHEPKVVTIDLKPTEKTLVLLPVYQRMPKNDPLEIKSLNNDGVFKG